MLRRPPTRIELKAEDKDEVRANEWTVKSFSRDGRERAALKFLRLMMMMIFVFENDSTD